MLYLGSLTMKECQRTQLKPGMITAVPVSTPSGQIILHQNTILTNDLIHRLDFYNIKSIHILELDPIAELSYSQKVKKSPKFQKFELDFTFQTTILKENFQKIIQEESVHTDVLLSCVTSLIYEKQTTIDFFDMLHNFRINDDTIYAHSINVALISRIIGVWLKLSEEEINVLTLCGLLHDIGKTSIPNDILNKKEKLTDLEYALIKKHPQYGFEILKKQKDLDIRIIKTSLMHHERCDGSGYPLHLVQKDIDFFARIVSIADVYDAMTAARAYRSPLCPFEVIANFEEEGLQKYDPNVILTFLKRIASTYQNNRVMLSNGESAKIVLLNNQFYSKPLVELKDHSCVDLSKSELYIKAMI